MHIHVGRSIGVAAAAIAHRALDGVTARRQPSGVELDLRPAADDLSAGGGVAVGQGIAIRIAGDGSNSSTLARHNRAAVRRASYGGRLIRLWLHRDIRSASSRAAFAIVHLGVDGVGADAESGRSPARVGTGAANATARSGVGICELVVIRVAGIHVDVHAVA